MSCYSPQDLEHFAAALLSAGGFAPGHAEQTAKVLVWANARGADSHGVLRIPRYLEMVQQGIINPVAEPLVIQRDGATAILEAGNAPGASAMVAAMTQAVEIASGLGIGWCSARNITHAGAVGYYALEAAQRGYVGIVMTASGPLMAYHGAKVSGVSTNPLTIAAPSGGDPLLLDMSTSTAALGKIMLAKDAGTSIPDNWGLDDQGLATEDPASVKTLTPLGGPKGSGLSLMIEVLSSILVANPVIAAALEGGTARMNGLALAIKVSAFGDGAAFRNEIDRLATNLRQLPRAAGVDAILMPGERGFRTAQQRQRDGIRLAAGTHKRLTALAEQLGVAAPRPLEDAS
ncbi:Ldh family oxidoreductase [Devosia sp. BSSL-BM10]|uniref:Ldh family oxidoreductase n=1 Tax=Devosia litorisediminis TaxID=2829817 RepID=A0A942E7D9_9HYPH|nr:Ldh family oxidoreductase [Devosia litorisediminis]MBS3848822.1 Ldh family oxidoreductase [Devosia litorisediminis]